MAHAHTDPAELAELGAYRRSLLRRIRRLPPRSVRLQDAHGCVLAADVAADEDVPAFAASAVDGYAVVMAGLEPDVTLPVTGEAAAGRAGGARVAEGSCVRVMTGAPVPTGTEAVVPVEHVDELGDGQPGERIRLRRVPEAGQHVRPVGEAVARGERVLDAGTLVDAAAVGMLATVGAAEVEVVPPPRVGVLSTGDELVDPGTPLQAGQIRDANSWALAAALQEAGAVPVRLPRVHDDPDAIREAITGALGDLDALVTTGGVSAGRYDHVKGVMAELGDVRFTKVAVKPGMPQAFGFIDRRPCFGLPGNPVSALVSFEVFVRPALRRMQGRAPLVRPRVAAALAEPVTSAPHKVEFVRVRLERREDGWLATPTGAQGSGILRSMVEADGLAELGADIGSAARGDLVTVHLLRSL